MVGQMIFDHALSRIVRKFSLLILKIPNARIEPSLKEGVTHDSGKTLNHQSLGDFPGGPAVKTLSFHCRRHGFDIFSGN